MMKTIENKLRTRSTNELKGDAKEAMLSKEEGSAIVFCAALSVLEERLSEEDYIMFEESL